MSSTLPGTTTYYCRHGIDMDYCAVCRPPGGYQWPPLAAGHCGKCGAPYTVDYTDMITKRFNPTCKCWNV